MREGTRWPAGSAKNRTPTRRGQNIAPHLREALQKFQSIVPPRKNALDCQRFALTRERNIKAPRIPTSAVFEKAIDRK